MAFGSLIILLKSLHQYQRCDTTKLSKDIQLCLQRELGWARRGKASLTCGRYLVNIHEMPETASVHPILAVIFIGYLLYGKI